MLNVRRTAVVAHFEILEALQSRLALFALGIYAAIASIGTYTFLKAFAAIESSARQAIADATGADPNALPLNLVRDKALPLLVGLESDEGVRAQLLRMEPLGIFYSGLAINSVVLIVLAVSATAVATEIGSGASRFALLRCDRLSWATGKLLGHALLLMTALLGGALLTGGIGTQMEANYQAITWWWLLRSSCFAWIYGVSHLAIYFGISLVSRSAPQARFRAVFFTIALGVVHLFVDTDVADAAVPGIRNIARLMPNHYKSALGSAQWQAYVPASFALLAIGACAFLICAWFFERRDA